MVVIFFGDVMVVIRGAPVLQYRRRGIFECYRYSAEHVYGILLSMLEWVLLHLLIS